MSYERPHTVRQVLALLGALALPGCSAPQEDPAAVLRVPFLSAAVTVDGRLEEAAYREHAPLDAFVVAGDAAREAPSTKAWLFWSEDRLTFAFESADGTPAQAPPTSDERDVDGQDRVELFVWGGDPDRPYYCIEIAPGGAVHDYRARFYRRFDDGWSPQGGWEYQVVSTPSGYTVEAVLPGEAVEAMGEALAAGHRFRAGLFRADFDRLNGTPTWITWVDHGGEPDFHLAESFGTVELVAGSGEEASGPAPRQGGE